MAKNIVICCDGTKNEFGAHNTNVVRLYSVLNTDPAKQIIYYHPGLGTIGDPRALTPIAKWWTKMLGLAFGYGLSQHLCDLCGFLMSSYEPGDRIFLFGFSRGAYTVRAVCSMLHAFGLIRKGDEVLLPYSIRLLKGWSESTFATAGAFCKTFSEKVKPHFVGIWDTVNSVGTLHTPLKLPFSANNPDIVISRHAVAIDERRAFYRQNLWFPGKGQNIKQVWFAGVHCDVGGGYSESESGLSKIALEWMAGEAILAGLLIDAEKLKRVLGGSGQGFAPPDPLAQIHDSLKGWWWAELIPRRYTNLRTPEKRKEWKIPMARRRFIADGALIHESVFERRDKMPTYRAPNLPAKCEVERTRGSGANT